MPKAHSPAEVTPALSLQLSNSAVADPGIGGWRQRFAQVRGAEAAGIDRIAASDHVILGENLENYAKPELGGLEGGEQPTGSEGHWLDPLVLLTMYAAQTSRMRLQTGILIAALRRPATLAKHLATIDVLSEGRLDIGVGVGWQREEYEANGIPWEHRGARLDQTLDICQTLWRNEAAAYSSDEVNFEKIHCNPKPLQPGGVPFWISGTLNKNVLNRIAKYGSGWIPWGPDMANPGEGMKRVRETLAAAGRDAEGFQCTSFLPVMQNADGSLDISGTVAAAPALVEAGITDTRIRLDVPEEQQAAQDLLAPIVEAFRKAVGR